MNQIPDNYARYNSTLTLLALGWCVPKNQSLAMLPTTMRTYAYLQDLGCEILVPRVRHYAALIVPLIASADCKHGAPSKVPSDT